MIDSLNTNDKIRRFVEDFNKDKVFKDWPILSFQFVSLDDAEKGDLVWWTYSHKEIKNNYNDCIVDFTGLSDGKIDKTLIFDDYKGGVYYYEKLGKEKIINNTIEITDFITLKPERDQIGKVGDKQHKDKSSDYLKHWQGILENKFNGGSTMWISIPHTEIGGTSIIFSSIFIVFNTQIVLKDDAYKKIRNFIIDYLIELYDNKSAIKQAKKAFGFEEETEISKDSFLIKEYKTSITSLATNTFRDLEKKYLIDDNLLKLLEINKIANTLLTQFFETPYSEKASFFEINKRERTLYVVGTLKKKNLEEYRSFLLARIIFLVLHIVGEYSALKTWTYLNLYLGAKRGVGKYLFRMDNIRKCLNIKGLQSDYPDGTIKLDLNKVVESISEVEFDQITDLARKAGRSTLNEVLRDIKNT
jgi:hypothetical protein